MIRWGTFWAILALFTVGVLLTLILIVGETSSAGGAPQRLAGWTWDSVSS